MTMAMKHNQKQKQKQKQNYRFAFVAKLLFAICLFRNYKNNNSCCWCHGFSFSPRLTTKTKKKTVEARWRLSSTTNPANRQQSSSDSDSTTALFAATDFIEKKTTANQNHSKQSTTATTTTGDTNNKRQQLPTQQPLSKNQEALKMRKFPRTWVPLASVYELDPDRPTPLEFLDQKFVCYKQTPAQHTNNNNPIEDDWIVADDACPHRLAPLSEGRIERNSTAVFGSSGDDDETNAVATIQCSYHGWEFDGRPDHGKGACVRIPQVSPDQETAAVRSHQSRLQTYGTRVYKNVLWFWPWPDADAIGFALEEYPGGHPEGFTETIAAGLTHPTTYTRDLPYGWDTLLENLIDPAHIPFAHHNLQGKREDAIPIEMTVPESLGGFGSGSGRSSNNGNSNNSNSNSNSNNSNSNSNSNSNNSNHHHRSNNGHERDDKPDAASASASGASKKRLGEAGFFFEWQDRTMGKHRGGIAEFKAPYGIGYEGFFYPSKEDADAARGTHVANKRKATKQKQKQKQPSLLVSSNENSGETETEEEEKEELRVFQLGVLCIPTKPGWSRAIIFAGGQAKQPKKKNDNAQLESTTTDDDETENAKTKKKKKKKKSLVMMVFGLLPPWVIHMLSNRFLDSDLAFLHYQEQERLRRSSGSNSNNNNHGYYMPAQADRCIAALRQWLPLYTDYLGGGPTNRVYALPPPITDRTRLFDRYSQHTSHCKHCQEGLEIVTTTAPRMAKLGIVASLLASHLFRTKNKAVWSLLAKMVALSCWGLLGLLRKIEPAFRVGEFKHYQNH